MNTDQLLNDIEKKISPEEFHAVIQYVKKDVRVLGTDEIFALRDSKGVIRAFKKSIHLSAAGGTLIQPVQSGPFVISAQGYEVLSEGMGICVILPKTVLVDGQTKSNPFVLRDEKNNRIIAIYARAVAFRYSSMGIPQVADWSTMFDTPAYRMIDLLAKAKKFPQAFQLLPKNLEPNSNGTWAAYPFDEMTELFVNTSHPEAIGWYQNILNREKKAIDYAQTFARRNAVKHLTGLQKAPGPEWHLTVNCWRPLNGSIIKWDGTQYALLQDAVENMIEGADIERKQIELKKGDERVSDEEGHEGIETEIDPEDQEPIEVTPEKTETVQVDPGPKPEEPKAKPKTPPPREYSDEEKVILSNYTVAKNNFQDEYHHACRELKLDPSIVHDPAQAAQIIRKINEVLDAG
jgi:hypothetical protein